METIGKHILGYLIGITLFVIAIPAMLLYFIQFLDWKILIESQYQNVLVAFAMVFFLLGILFVIGSNLFLVLKGKGGPTEGLGVSVSPKTLQLVTSGPYKFTRNPMAFGMLSIYYSLSFYLNSLVGLVLNVFITIIAVFYLRNSEEKRLFRDFGEAYISYKEQTPILIPYPKGLIRSLLSKE